MQGVRLFFRFIQKVFVPIRPRYFLSGGLCWLSGEALFVWCFDDTSNDGFDIFIIVIIVDVYCISNSTTKFLVVSIRMQSRYNSGVSKLGLILLHICFRQWRAYSSICRPKVFTLYLFSVTRKSTNHSVFWNV